MDLYLDDCADANLLVRVLQDSGYTVYTPRIEETSGLPDADHLRHAANCAHTLITKNPKDFLDLHQEWQVQGRKHSGILLIYEDNVKGKDMEAGDIARAIGNLLSSSLSIENEVHILFHWR